MNFSEEFNDFCFTNGVTYIEYDQLKKSNRFYSTSIKMINTGIEAFNLPENAIMFTARSKNHTTGPFYFWLTNDERRSLVKKIEFLKN